MVIYDLKDIMLVTLTRLTYLLVSVILKVAFSFFITEAFFSHPFLEQVPVKKCEYPLFAFLLKIECKLKEKLVFCITKLNFYCASQDIIELFLNTCSCVYLITVLFFFQIQIEIVLVIAPFLGSCMGAVHSRRR